MNGHLLGCVLASALAATAAAAQTPRSQDPPPQNPTQQRPVPPANPPADRADRARQDQARTVTVEGCVVREADVPGRTPTVTERAGIAEDYILTNAKVIRGVAPSITTKPTTTGAVGTGGERTPTMFEIVGIGGSELKKHVNRRVRIDGVFEQMDKATTSADTSARTGYLVELRGTTIRAVAGECGPIK